MDHALSVAVDCTAPALRPRSRPSSETSRRLLVIGTGRRAAGLIRTLLGNGVGTIVACVDPQPQGHVASQIPEMPIRLDTPELETLILEEGVDEIFVALPLRSCFDDCRRIEAVARELGVPVHFDFDWVDPAYARLVRTSNTSLITCHEHPSARPVARACKRAFDVIGACVALLIVSPVLLLAAVLVKLSSPGPVFFRQPRVGRHRRVFEMMKLRTMVAEAEALRSTVQNDAKGIMFKVSRDPRVTGVGRWLRRTSVDELPQLFNVLRGEMSLVGPRPIPTWVFDQASDPHFHRRFAVMPGMTGLWQVNGREQHYMMMARHDLAYVDRWSFWLDVKLLLMTIPVVIQGRGAQ